MSARCRGSSATVTRAQLTPDQVAAAIEKAAAQLFRRDLVTVPSLAARGDLYKDWWLKEGDLPAKFFEAFNAALEATYGPGARVQLRPAAGSSALAPQASRPFWQRFEPDAPPDLSVRLLEDGYATFRSVMESSYTWNFGDWLAGTAWIFFPPIAAYPLIVAMPQTRALFKDNAQVDGHPVDKELGWFGLVMAPLVTSALAPIVLSIYIAALTYYGVGRETVFGWVTGGLNLITSIIFLATIGKDVDPAIRWLLLFIVPFVGLLVHAIYVLGRGGSDPRHTQLALSSLIPCIITAIYILFHLAWHQSQDLGMNGWLKESGGHREEWGNGGFIGGWILWAVLMIGSWLLVSHLLQPSKGSEPAADQFVTGQKHFLRLFGHSSLLFDPNLAQDPNAESRKPSLATQYFPTDRRPLLKIWWEGGGELWMRSERNALQFSTSQDGTGNPQTILAPAAPMTAAEFARFLGRAVKEGAAFNQKLKAELFDADDFDYVLPPGAVFSDNGDDQTTVTSHKTEALKFVKLKTTKDDATVLFHAPRGELAGFQGSEGPVFVDVDRAAAVAGAGQATFTGAGVVGNAATRFTMFFKRGDVIGTIGVAAGDESRIVASVQDDQTLSVTMPFTAAVGGALQNYQRAATTRDTDTAAGTLQETAAFRVYQGAGFDAIFLPGDTVRAVPAAPGTPEERTVIQVISATQIMVDRPFAVAAAGTLPPAAGVPCVRVGRLTREGFGYAPVSPVGIFAGDSLMERAADLGAVLCMGASTHMLTSTERAGGDHRPQRRSTAGGEPGVSGVPQLEPEPATPERVADDDQRRRGQRKARDAAESRSPPAWRAVGMDGVDRGGRGHRQPARLGAADAAMARRGAPARRERTRRRSLPRRRSHQQEAQRRYRVPVRSADAGVTPDLKPWQNFPKTTTTRSGARKRWPHASASSGGITCRRFRRRSCSPARPRRIRTRGRGGNGGRAISEAAFAPWRRIPATRRRSTPVRRRAASSAATMAATPGGRWVCLPIPFRSALSRWRRTTRPCSMSAPVSRRFSTTGIFRPRPPSR